MLSVAFVRLAVTTSIPSATLEAVASAPLVELFQKTRSQHYYYLDWWLLHLDFKFIDEYG